MVSAQRVDTSTTGHKNNERPQPKQILLAHSIRINLQHGEISEISLSKYLLPDWYK